MSPLRPRPKPLPPTLRCLIPTFCLGLALSGWSAAAAAPLLDMPFPVLSEVALPAEHAAYPLPVAGFDGTSLPVEMVEGMVDRRAYRLDAPGASVLDLLAPLRDQLVAAGYRVVLDCAAQACGGFDFRFATQVMDEPAMHVDLGEFRFLSARRGDEALSLLVSRAGDFGFVQVISVGAEPLPRPGTEGDPDDPGAGPNLPVAPVAPIAPVAPLDPPDARADGSAPQDVLSRLEAGLPVVLEDLAFASGSSALLDGDYASLQGLTDWLAADARRSLALVGHSDGSGGLQANVALSQRRAAAVRQVLMQRYGVKGAQVTAEGVGPLAPRASNLTEEGRQKNRRVEAVPAPTL
jgi:outer membrane protein OmpA-like peptidoglycan-associated protein